MTRLQKACGTYKFDATTTGLSYYDAMLGKGEIVGKYKDNPKEYFKNVKGIDKASILKLNVLPQINILLKLLN